MESKNLNNLDEKTLQELAELFLGFLPEQVPKSIAKRMIDAEMRKYSHAEIKADMMEIFVWISERIIPKLDKAEKEKWQEKILETIKIMVAVYAPVGVLNGNQIE